MLIEFHPTLKSTSMSSGKKKVVLEIEKHLAKGILGSIDDLEGERIRVTLEKITYRYGIPYDKQSEAAQMTYQVNPDGTVEKIVEEQTNLLENVDEIEERFFLVEREVIDEFIIACPKLDYPGPIKPKEILSQLNNKISLETIAKTLEMTEEELSEELEKARGHYAPYADMWHKKREKDGFSFNSERVNDDD